MSAPPSRLPLIYSCSGCSSAAQLTNALALQLTREGLGEMSCIAGVGGGVPALLRLARAGRP
ncbi:MAG: zinc-binding protein, partial [Burkholderiales bacterium]